MREFLRKLVASDQGISAVEYALLLAMIGATIAVAMAALGGVVAELLGDTAASLDQPD